MTYTADPDSLRGAGASSKSAGEQASQVKLGPPAQDIAGAMPGGESADLAEKVAQSWEKATEQWSRAAVRHGDSLIASGDDYEESDRSGAESIRAAGGR
ncbi:hypothetical protein [Saccharopolyspora sp. NPDC002686]|uniref:hypothetical protein n=1 Tax=Saccharopolyspora sp. NPDC002686 TaxID=3154541 RepID=UPI0033201464